MRRRGSRAPRSLRWENIGIRGEGEPELSRGRRLVCGPAKPLLGLVTRHGLKRVFTASWQLGGRWYAVGNEGNYQRMSEAEWLVYRL
jgi:hypothetical protein